MPFFPMLWFGGSMLLNIFISIISAIFVSVIFVFLAMELQWRKKSILLLILLIISSIILGLFSSSGIEFIGEGDYPKSVSLKDAAKMVDFKIIKPKYLPEGMSFRGAEIMPGPPEFNEISLHYNGLGRDMNIRESRGIATSQIIGGPPMKTEMLKINGKPAKLLTDKYGYSDFFFDVDNISIEISTNLPKSEIIKVASSLK